MNPKTLQPPKNILEMSLTNDIEGPDPKTIGDWVKLSKENSEISPPHPTYLNLLKGIGNLVRDKKYFLARSVSQLYYTIDELENTIATNNERHQQEIIDLKNEFTQQTIELNKKISDLVTINYELLTRKGD